MFQRAPKPGESAAPFGRGGRPASRSADARMGSDRRAAEAPAAARAPRLPGDVLEVTRLLAGIREAQGLSREQMASRVGGHPMAIAALEEGALQDLPAWPETRRIVDQWVSGAGLDSRPALSALGAALATCGRPAPPPSPPSAQTIAAELERTTRRDRQVAVEGPSEVAGRSRPRAMPPPPAGITPPVARGPERVSPPPRQTGTKALGLMRRSGKMVARAIPVIRRPSLGRLAFGLPPSRPIRWAVIVLILAAMGTSATQTRVVAGALSHLPHLPAPAGNAMRSISDFFAVRFAPVRNGHRWIDVGDPRSRRSDKLRISRHSD